MVSGPERGRFFWVDCKSTTNEKLPASSGEQLSDQRRAFICKQTCLSRQTRPDDPSNRARRYQLCRSPLEAGSLPCVVHPESFPRDTYLLSRTMNRRGQSADLVMPILVVISTSLFAIR